MSLYDMSVVVRVMTIGRFSELLARLIAVIVSLCMDMLTVSLAVVYTPH